MQVLVLIGLEDRAFADAAFAACEQAAAPLGLGLALRQLPGEAALRAGISAAKAGEISALILTPPPGAQLGPELEGAPFSVEVQPENTARSGAPGAGTSAQLLGLGMAGYGEALRLIAERGA